MMRVTTVRRAVIIGLWLTSLVLVGLIETVEQAGVFRSRTAPATLLAATYGTVFSTLGALILRRHPRHRVGWLFLVIGAAGAVELAGSQIGYWIGGTLGGSLAVASEALRLLNFGALGLLLLIYPTGRLLSQRWRWAAVAVGFFVFGAISALITPRQIPELAPLRGPIRVAALQPVADLLEGATGVAMIGVLSAVVSLVLRFRRAPSIERQQIKLFALAAVACVVVIAGFTVALPQQMDGWPGDVVWNTPVVLLPAAAAFAILRHGLYDIDRIISRTVSYAILTALLGGTFALLVLFPPVLLGGEEAPDYVIAVATLVVAALFRSVRRRVQNVVDHRFNRRRYDVQHTIEAFTTRLREQIDIDALSRELENVVLRTMQPTDVKLRLR